MSRWNKWTDSELETSLKFLELDRDGTYKEKFGLRFEMSLFLILAVSFWCMTASAYGRGISGVLVGFAVFLAVGCLAAWHYWRVKRLPERIEAISHEIERRLWLKAGPDLTLNQLMVKRAKLVEEIAASQRELAAVDERIAEEEAAQPPDTALSRSRLDGREEAGQRDLSLTDGAGR